MCDNYKIGFTNEILFDWKCVLLTNGDNRAERKEYMICMMVTIVLIAAVGLPVLSGLVLFVLLPPV